MPVLVAKMSTTVVKSKYTTIEAAGREVKLSNPDKVFFPKPGFTKLDLAPTEESEPNLTAEPLLGLPPGSLDRATTLRWKLSQQPGGRS